MKQCCSLALWSVGQNVWGVLPIINRHLLKELNICRHCCQHQHSSENVCVCVWHEHKLNAHIFSVATVSSFLLPLIVQILGCRTNSLGWFSMSSIGLYFVSPCIAPWSMVWPKRVHTLIHLSTWMSLTRKLGGPCEIQSETANVR